jgi:hypothetical protein
MLSSLQRPDIWYTDNELFQDGTLTAAMDMFSFGYVAASCSIECANWLPCSCLVYEFYTEGMPLFTLADLLSYREVSLRRQP